MQYIIPFPVNSSPKATNEFRTNHLDDFKELALEIELFSATEKAFDILAKLK